MEYPPRISDKGCDERSLRNNIIEAFMEQKYFPEVERKLAGLLSGHSEVGKILKQTYREIHFPHLPCARGLLLAQNEVKAPGPVKPQWRLEMTHNCIIPACADTLCKLCEKSPERRCGVDCLKEKYCAGKGLVTKCDQTVLILLKHDSTGEVAKVDGDVMVSLVNSQECEAYFQERAPLCSDDVSGCLVNQKHACLTSKLLPNRNRAPEGLIMPMKNGHAYLPRDVTTTATTINAFRSKAIKYQLLIRVVPGTGNMPASGDTFACISNSFTTLTSRSMLAQKKTRPLVTDDIKTVPKIGRETVKKFNTLKNFVQDDGVPDSIKTVGELRELFKLMNQNVFLSNKVQSALRIPGEDWEIICKVSKQAIEHDNFVRSWGPFKDPTGTYQLLYACESGRLSLSPGPIAIIKNERVVPREAWDNTLATLIKTLNTMAKNCWWQKSHPGWGILPSDINSYEEDPAIKNLFTASESSLMSSDSDDNERLNPPRTKLLNSSAPLPSKVVRVPSSTYEILPSSPALQPAASQGNQSQYSCLSPNLLQCTSESGIFPSSMEARYPKTPSFSSDPYVAGHSKLKEIITDAQQSSPAMGVDHNMLYDDLCCVTTFGQHSGDKRKRAEVDESEDSDYQSKAAALLESVWTTSSADEFSSPENSHLETDVCTGDGFPSSFDFPEYY